MRCWQQTVEGTNYWFVLNTTELLSQQPEEIESLNSRETVDVIRYVKIFEPLESLIGGQPTVECINTDVENFAFECDSGEQATGGEEEIEVGGNPEPHCCEFYSEENYRGYSDSVCLGEDEFDIGGYFANDFVTSFKCGEEVGATFCLDNFTGEPGKLGCDGDALHAGSDGAEIEDYMIDASSVIVSRHLEAFMYHNNDCTGKKYKWTLPVGQDEVEADNLVLDKAGWHDRGESIKVPKGLSLKLVMHVHADGLAEIFPGEEDENGMVCQKLPWFLRDNVSSSLLFRGTESGIFVEPKK